MRPKPKQIILSAVIFLAVLGVALAVRLWPRTVPFDQCSDLYKQYADMEGIDATFIKDYKVNDTVFVDVTLLEATDSVGWVTLKKDFDIVDITPELQQFIDNGENLIFTKLIPKSSFSDTTSCPYKDDLLAISFLTKTLTVFHIKNKEELNAVRHYNYDKSTNQ